MNQVKIPLGQAIQAQRTNVWSVRLVNRIPAEFDDTHGIAFFDSQTIYAVRRSDPVDSLNTLLHEVLHGEFPDLSEDAVHRGAGHLATLLIELDLIKIGRLRKAT